VRRGSFEPEEIISIFNDNYSELSIAYRELYNSREDILTEMLNTEGWLCILLSEIERIANVRDGEFTRQQCLDYLKGLKERK
jgi:alpha-mannosidase